MLSMGHPSWSSLPDTLLLSVGQDYFTPVLLCGGFLERLILRHHTASDSYSVLQLSSDALTHRLNTLVKYRVRDRKRLGRRQRRSVRAPRDHLEPGEL